VFLHLGRRHQNSADPLCQIFHFWRESTFLCK
jgi:hypothetical protein